MKKIVQYWEISDFCRIYGRIMPYFKGNSDTFSEFYCSRLEDVKIVCSEGKKDTKISFIIMTSGYVVKFANEVNYLFCTASEFQKLEEESKLVEEKQILEEESKLERKQKVDNNNVALSQQNPAQPYGVKITKELQDFSHMAYYACTKYPSKIDYFRYLLKERILDFNTGVYVCEKDCLFPKCPFYSIRNVCNYINHSNDYDDWIEEIWKVWETNRSL